MFNSTSRIPYLLQRYADSSCTRAELRELLQLLRQDDTPEGMDEAMWLMWEQLKAEEKVPGVDKEEIINNILHNIDTPALPQRHFTIQRWAIAAAILMFVSVGIFLLRSPNGVPSKVAYKKHQVILPGTNKAELILANGKKMILSDTHGSEITNDNGITTIRLDKNNIAYSGSLAPASAGRPVWNILSTPAGGQYQVTLPDGTQVWLNASSSLKFPVKFGDSTRRVELTGEGYFEVAKNRANPFIVATARSEIKVLGTHFNVMAYSNEPTVNTTLLEGSVQVSKGALKRTLVPGQQSRVNTDIQVAEVDADQSIEWKNGKFNFAHEKIPEIMRKIARWYDVQIIYRGKPTSEGFVGTVPRSRNLTEVLSTLESTGLVHFKVEERSVIVMP
ncbi:FecR domain-containing protein [Mucilaginibacter daejeonensis]|uniref:FecR family protein n=1 Tax=Mucilaginibacter daejeonensis TaxID=398049 RepID=UPI001D17950F|nr:FecR family protein [Mucilaginibacter daejeonensis]UEG51907.1 FecR domain-containing protein [Mucilaginibacter daejeonensis]